MLSRLAPCRLGLMGATVSLLSVCLVMPLAGQAPVSRVPPNPDARARALYSLERSARESARKKEAADARRRQYELRNRLAEFANSWNKLMQLAEKGVWNARTAHETRKAFERLTRTEGWIEEPAVASR